MKMVLCVFFYAAVLVVVGSFIGQGYGMQMAQYTPGGEARMNPVVKKSVELYKSVSSWCSRTVR